MPLVLTVLGSLLAVRAHVGGKSDPKAIKVLSCVE